MQVSLEGRWTHGERGKDQSNAATGSGTPTPADTEREAWKTFFPSLQRAWARDALTQMSDPPRPGQ